MRWVKKPIAAQMKRAQTNMTYVVDGNKCANIVPQGQYFQLINSTITGRSDGVYTASKAIPANEVIDNTYFNQTSPIAEGAINKINGELAALNSNINNFGVIITGDKNSATVAVPNNTGTLISTIVLTKGVWVVIGCADWASNENGYRQIAFNGDAMNPSRNAASTVNGINGKEAYQQITFIRATNGETFNMYARQTSGGNLNVYPYLYAIKVGTNA